MWRMLLDSSFDDLIYIFIYISSLFIWLTCNWCRHRTWPIWLCFLDLQLLLLAVLETYYYYCHCNVSNITVCALLLACLCVASEPSNWRQLGATFNLARSSCGLLPMFLWRRFTIVHENLVGCLTLIQEFQFVSSSSKWNLRSVSSVTVGNHCLTDELTYSCDFKK